jgi:hypothetical protein
MTGSTPTVVKQYRCQDVGFGVVVGQAVDDGGQVYTVTCWSDGRWTCEGDDRVCLQFRLNGGNCRHLEAVRLQGVFG